MVLEQCFGGGSSEVKGSNLVYGHIDLSFMRFSTVAEKVEIKWYPNIHQLSHVHNNPNDKLLKQLNAVGVIVIEFKH